jgi:hypothetical protein
MIPRGTASRVTLETVRGPEPQPQTDPVPNSEDRTMKKARLLLVAVLASLAVSACSASPTFPDTCVDPGTNSSRPCE